MIYSRDQIEDALSDVWDPDMGFGTTNPLEPDHDMPRGPGADPSHSGGNMAARADLSRAWGMAPLTATERRRVFMSYALYWPIKMIVAHEEVARQPVQRSIESGLEKLTMIVNGSRREGEGAQAEVA